MLRRISATSMSKLICSFAMLVQMLYRICLMEHEHDAYRERPMFDMLFSLKVANSGMPLHLISTVGMPCSSFALDVTPMLVTPASVCQHLVRGGKTWQSPKPPISEDCDPHPQPHHTHHPTPPSHNNPTVPSQAPHPNKQHS